MRKDPGRNSKSHYVGGNVVRLDDIVCIVVIEKPSKAKLNVPLAYTSTGEIDRFIMAL